MLSGAADGADALFKAFASLPPVNSLSSKNEKQSFTRWLRHEWWCTHLCLDVSACPTACECKNFKQFLFHKVGFECPTTSCIPTIEPTFVEWQSTKYVPATSKNVGVKSQKKPLRWLYTRMKLCMRFVSTAAGDLLNVCSSTATGVGNVLSRHDSDQNTCSLHVVHDYSATGVFSGVFQVIYHTERLTFNSVSRMLTNVDTSYC